MPADPKANMPTVTVERVRDAIRWLTIVPYAEGGTRHVHNRNRMERARVVDAVRLDDVWRALDELADNALLDDEVGR